MKAAEAELVALRRKLSPKQCREFLKFGRQLYTQEEKKAPAVEEDGDAAWERIIANPKPRPQLAAMAATARAEMKAGKHYPEMRLEDL